MRMYILRDCPRKKIVRNRVKPTRCHRQTKVDDHWSGSASRTVVGLREIGWKSFPFTSVPAKCDHLTVLRIEISIKAGTLPLAVLL